MSTARTFPHESAHIPDEPIAVVGLSCRFPGAPNPAAYWGLLRNGESAVREALPARRHHSTGSAGFLDHVDLFDPDFFDISPREATAMDPQQRLALELSWEALEDAGTVPADLRDREVGVFVGAMWDDYSAVTHRLGAGSAGRHSMTGLHRGVIANRVSYTFDLRGPSMVLDTGQSSSLVAVHTAVESLRRGESALALAGGVNLMLAPESTLHSERFGGLSPDGQCFTFDARANGYVRGEGAGFVVLKPLSRALGDGDHVYCVIESTAMNNDGAGEGLTVPTSRGQQEVLRSAYGRAGVDPATVQYVELHGTGTKAGDPIESAALGAVLGADRRAGDAPLLVGSVKTNIGHLEAAAGVAGLIKTALSIEHREIPPSLNFVTPNPLIPLAEWNLRVQTEPGPWPRPDGLLLAGVSAFGMGGTNCHVVLSDAHRAPVPASDGPPAGSPSAGSPALLPWVVSGRSRAALRAQAGLLHERLAADPAQDPASVGVSLSRHRTAFEERAVVLGGDRGALLGGLEALVRDAPAPNLVRGSARGAGGTAFLFTGQGSQRPGMGRQLYARVPVFAEALDEVAAQFEGRLSHRLQDVIFAEPGTPEAALLDRTDFTQVSLFALEVALFSLVRRCGPRPDFLLGHSVGELVAAQVSGVLSLADACTLVEARGRLMRRATGGGAMIALQADEREVRAALPGPDGPVSVAAVNGPLATVISGDREAAERVAEEFAARGRKTKRLTVSHAFHSPHMDGVLEEFRSVAARLTYHAPAIPVVSNVTGALATAEELGSPDYWTRHIRTAVRFLDGVRLLRAEGVTSYLELGPGGLAAMAREGLADGNTPTGAAVVPLLRDRQPEDRTVTTALAEVFVRGARVDWQALTGWTGERTGLPTYAFQRRPFWLADADGAAGTGAGEPRTTDDASPAVEDATDDASPAVGTAATPQARVHGAAADLHEVVGASVASVLGHLSSDTVEMDRTFKELGFDSLTAVEFRDRVAEATGLERLAPTLIYNHPTPEELVRFLRGELSGEQPASEGPRRRAAAGDEPIAIVGMGCRFPGGVSSPEDLWRLVSEGRDAISGFPSDRGWSTEALSDPENPEVRYAREGGFLYDAAAFDAEFFGISPREALAMDPQQRLLLETGWEALERAGIVPTSLRGRQVGVFAGATAQDYGPRLGEPGQGAQGYLLTGNTASVISGRLSYTLGLEGPAVTVDTACSSSLTALHLACGSLRRGECAMALAGGVTVMATPGMFVEFARQRGLAPDGRCKPFAGAADGTGWSEGVGMVVLERLSDAQRHGHQVLAVVRGSAVNQDGASNGLTAPNGPSQERVIRQALSDAGLSAQDIDAVEAHGTGTRLGDPIEAQALVATYGQGRDGAAPLWLGSVKSNIGHTQAAAGIAAVIKMVMALRHGRLPASLHIDEPTPHVDWSAGSVALLTDAVEWPEGERVRRAGVSSFGISGTNVHAILEQAPAAGPAAVATREPQGPEDRAAPRAAAVPWLLSAKTPEALRDQAMGLRARLDGRDGLAPADVGLSLATTRAVFEHRAVLTGADRSELLAALDALVRDAPSDRAVRGRAESGTRTVFVFPGQGAQWAGMAVELLDSSAVFRARMEECDAALGAVVDWSLLEVLREAPGAPTLRRVDVVQPALFAVMVSLARLWESYGVRPSAVVGHSQGEIAAACVAGGLSLADAAKIVALRSLALTAVSGLGGMVSVSLSVERIRQLPCWDARLDIAVINGPSSVVVSGEQRALEELLAACAAEGVRAKQIPVSYAAHSAQVEAIRERLLEVLDEVEPRSGDVPFYSTVTGELLDTRELNAEYWYRNLREPVEFERTMGTVLKKGRTLLVEISPHPVLGVGAQEALETFGGSGAVVGSLYRGDGGPGRFLTSLAQAFVLGAPVDWRAAFAGSGAAPTDLPTYAFQRRRYWLTPEAAPEAAPATAGNGADERFWDVVERGDARELAAEVGLGEPEAVRALLPALAAWRRRQREEAAVGSWHYRTAWQSLPKAGAGSLSGRWLVVVREGAEREQPAAAVLEVLDRSGADVVALAVPPGLGRRELAGRLRSASPGDGGPAGVLALPAPDAGRVPSAAGHCADVTLVQALGDNGWSARLWCVTRGAVTVGAGDPVTAPAQTQVWGLGRVAAVEHPERWGGLVDLPAEADARALGQLPGVLAGVYGGDGENQLAVRVEGVFGRRLLRAPEAATGRPWVPRGTVLITGGTGALGGHTARWLAGNGAEHLVLVSRSGRDAVGAAVLESELAALGARVTTVACDVTDREALAGLLAGLDADGSPLRAVVHAAGSIEKAPLDSLTPSRFAAVLGAKADAAHHLHELTQDRDLDAFVMYSSVSALWGGSGYGGYSAANAYQDGLAEYRRGRGLRATSVIWGPWAEDGMTSRDGMERELARQGLRLLAPDRAIEALRSRVGDDPSPVVADVDWETFYAGFSSTTPSRLFHEVPEVRRALLETPSRTGAADAAPAETLARQLGALPARKRRAATSRIVAAQVAAVLGHADAGRIGDRSPFKELGVDSVIAVELRNRLQDRTGLSLPVTVVFNHPSLERLVDFLIATALPESGIESGREDHAESAGEREMKRERDTHEAEQKINEMDAEELVRLVLGED
ncbi:type I polyketide synthase [Streptomyces corynorhini]|uniref:SDR family NAD(P)-dependent oxidoreductase n=1 Tax=Streptomyces corynorhini TaxID=2282652 RepID=A0A370BJ43_9ACTN|nr:type I polyketide synthase [Streptomyces corynorhini]RDG39793.1 SDR family NAD(P)-dependent oxidoreductase [Streptomyces corynorhini]